MREAPFHVVVVFVVENSSARKSASRLSSQRPVSHVWLSVWRSRCGRRADLNKPTGAFTSQRTYRQASQRVLSNGVDFGVVCKRCRVLWLATNSFTDLRLTDRML